VLEEVMGNGGVLASKVGSGRGSAVGVGRGSLDDGSAVGVVVEVEKVDSVEGGSEDGSEDNSGEDSRDRL
jgi:hypothetical protein